MRPPRTKEDARRQAFAFKGNAWLLEKFLEPTGVRLLEHPNRTLERHRSSNRRRAA